MKNYKMSFCVTCMNRSEFIKETLLHNLKIIYSLKDKYDLEIVLINYDSKDDLDEYIKSEHFYLYKKIKMLNYKKVYNKDFFSMMHAKNIAHLAATGDIVCNLDGDCYLSEKLIEETYSYFNQYGIDNVIVHHQYESNWGYVCLSKHNFNLIGGYDENMYGAGGDDNDLLIRFYLQTKCKIKKLENNYSYLNIEHGDSFRECEIDNVKCDKGTRNHINSIICDYNLRNNIIKPNGDDYGDVNKNIKFKELINHKKYIKSNYEKKLYEETKHINNDNWLYSSINRRIADFIRTISF